MIKPIIRAQIKGFLEGWLESIIEEIKAKSSILKATDFRPIRDFSKEGNIKPFQEALLPEGILRINEFERTLSTKLGTSYEECARLIATQKFPTVQRGYRIEGPVSKNAIKEIENLTNKVNTNGRPENYLDLVKKIVSISKDGKDETRSRVTDLYLKDKDGNETFFEIKSPKPNKGQCVEVLDRQLQTHAIRRAGAPKVRTYFAMAYNPYGSSRSSYKHSFSIKYLDMENQVLLGKEFWDFLGGSGTNEEIVAIYQEVGKAKAQDIIDKLALDY